MQPFKALVSVASLSAESFASATSHSCIMLSIANLQPDPSQAKRVNCGVSLYFHFPYLAWCMLCDSLPAGYREARVGAVAFDEAGLPSRKVVLGGNITLKDGEEGERVASPEEKTVA